MNMLGISSSVHFAHIACYWTFLPFALHTSLLSVQALQSRSCLSYCVWVWVLYYAGGQSASLSWLTTRFLLLSDSCGFVYVRRPLWREDGSFVYNCFCPRQRSLFPVRVPWDSWSYFTVSNSRLPFSSPRTTRRATVEVFEPASTRDTNCEASTVFL
jgi:hypothetical protein